ncbi:hypothetical protein [Niabella hibiscisoli]|uniref:hypothetical protein n=1 Tax=Niabella hibiscisoli TaxID=1825928 RepID=UPI001F0F8E95|nr:hypothetical protein [Niabella hibiscisoli]MCH5714680.1 hypothetical protein [Niabella hibiscisoli]
MGEKSYLPTKTAKSPTNPVESMTNSYPAIFLLLICQRHLFSYHPNLLSAKAINLAEIFYMIKLYSLALLLIITGLFFDGAAQTIKVSVSLIDVNGIAIGKATIRLKSATDSVIYDGQSHKDGKNIFNIPGEFTNSLLHMYRISH